MFLAWLRSVSRRAQSPHARLERAGRKPAGAASRGRRWGSPIVRRRPDRLNLALQGGGAHSAFTWGVLVRLLEADLRIEGISGASGGALNAVVLASGWLRGGSAGAAQALDELWREIGALARITPLRASGLGQLAADFAAQFLSPYQLNPLGVDPLRPVLERLVDFARLRATETPRLFIAATDVTTGRARIFRNPELSVEAVLASACLPQMHQAIEINGTPYWDGGFSANPPLVALVEACRARDVVLVQINPLLAERAPRTPREIRNRVAEIAFGRPLAEELERLRYHAGARFSPLRWLSRRHRRFVRHRLHNITAVPSWQGSIPGPRSIPSGRCCWTCAAAAGRRRMRGWDAIDGNPRPPRQRPLASPRKRPAASDRRPVGPALEGRPIRA
jgi:NTE family protein